MEQNKVVDEFSVFAVNGTPYYRKIKKIDGVVISAEEGELTDLDFSEIENTMVYFFPNNYERLKYKAGLSAHPTLENVESPEFMVLDALKKWVADRAESMLASQKNGKVLLVNTKPLIKINGKWFDYDVLIKTETMVMPKIEDEKNALLKRISDSSALNKILLDDVKRLTAHSRSQTSTIAALRTELADASNVMQESAEILFAASSMADAESAKSK